MKPRVDSCRDCGAALNPSETRGLCPACLIQTSLGAGEPEVNEPVDTAWLERNLLAGPPEFGQALHRLSDYELFEEIGRGGMGVIYRARQVSLDRFVAVKTILTGPLASADFTQRFQTEAHAAAVLDHPNIVPIYEVGNHHGQPFYSMRLVAGRNLAQELKATGPLPVRRAAALVATVARAVHYAHQRGVLHRDLKPANILMDAEGNPHVTDFGLAKLLEQDDGLTLTQAALGTPNYMAPEQAAGKTKQTSVAADVYSLGAILWELLTGRRLFDGLTPLATIAQVLEKDPPHPSSLNRAIPRDLDTICLKCLQKEPDQRYESALKFAEDLDHWLAGEPIEAAPVGPVGRTWRWCRRKPVLASMLGAVIALLLTVTVLSLTSARRIAAEFRRAEQNAKELRLNLYVADMNLANQAITETNLGLARELIRKYLPPDQQTQERTANRASASTTEELRGWEWRYLWGRCRGDSLSTIRSHSGAVTCALYSPDGKTLVTGGFDQTVRIREVATKRTLRHLTGFANPIQKNAVAFSPDGALLAVADCTDIQVFESTTWNKRRALPNQAFAGRLTSLPIAFSPDGKTLWCNANGELRQWDILTWERHDRSLQSQSVDFGALLALSPDGQQFVTAVEDGAIVWDDSSSDTPRRHFRIPLRWPQAVAYSPDAGLVAVVGLDHMGVVWDAKAGKEIARLDSDWPSAVTFSPDGARLATGGGSLRLWEVKTRALLASLKGRGSIPVLAFAPDGQTLVSGNGDGTVELWAATPQAAPDQHSLDGRPLGFSTDGRTLALLNTNFVVEYLDVQSGNRVDRFALPGAGGRREAVVLSPDGRRLAVVDTNGVARVWDTKSHERIAEVVLDPAPRWPWAVFSPDNRLMAVSCESRGDGGAGRTAVWDFRRQEIRALPDGNLYRPSFSANGQLLATGSDNQVQLWTVPDLRRLHTLAGHGWTIKSMSFSPDGSLLASAGRDRDIILWDVTTGKQRALLSANSQNSLSRASAFSLDGRTLASSDGRQARFWNVATGKPIFNVTGFGSLTSPPMFSPDGATLVVGVAESVFATDPVSFVVLHAPSMSEIEAAEKAETQLP